MLYSKCNKQHNKNTVEFVGNIAHLLHTNKVLTLSEIFNMWMMYIQFLPPNAEQQVK